MAVFLSDKPMFQEYGSTKGPETGISCFPSLKMASAHDYAGARELEHAEKINIFFSHLLPFSDLTCSPSDLWGAYSGCQGKCKVCKTGSLSSTCTLNSEFLRKDGED